jgi:hypothetical protein
LLASWTKYPYEIAAITTFIYIIVYYLLILHVLAIYRIFVPNNSDAFLEPDEDDHNFASQSIKAVLGLKSNNKARQERIEEQLREHEAKIAKAVEVSSNSLSFSLLCLFDMPSS